MSRRALLTLCALVVVAAGGAAPAGRAATPHPAPIPSRTSIPLGSSLWYACTDPDYAGTPYLACPVSTFDSRYATTYEQSFDRFTPENEFKMLWTQPANGTFDFSIADKVVAYARAHGKEIRGHTLVYAAADPDWVEHPSRPWTRASLLSVMQTRIATVVGRYRDAVHEWDVVNEPFSDSGAREPNVYQRTVGDDWVEQAFRAANAADPDALLFLNEFNADVLGPRQQAVLALVRDFVARGVPIDGVGLEMHTGADGAYPTAEQIEQVMAQYAALGLRVEVTEADALRPGDPSLDPVLVQRAAYDNAARACQEALNCTGMSVWGVADAYSWRGAGQTATLFTSSFNRKRAYDLVRCRLADPKPTSGPWTDTCGPPDATPPTIPVPTGPTGGPSGEPAPPAAPDVPTASPVPPAGISIPPVAPLVVPAPSTPGPDASTTPAPPRAVARTPVLTVGRPRPTRAQLSRGIAVRLDGARPGTPVALRLRHGATLLSTRSTRAGATGMATLTLRIPAPARRRLSRRVTLTLTASFVDATGRRAKPTRRLVVR